MAARPRRPRVTGIGGIFFKAKDPKALARWYRDRLGIRIEGSMAAYEWRGGGEARQKSHTILGPFPPHTPPLRENSAALLINLPAQGLASVGRPVLPVRAH